MKYLALIALIALSGCIEEGSNPDDDTTPDAQADAGATADATGGGGADAQGGPADAGPRPPARDASVPPDAAPPPDDACAAFCDRLDECLVPACPDIGERALTGICDGACQQPADRLRAATAGTCDQFNARLQQAIPQLGAICSGEQPPPVSDACAARCEQANACGFGIPPRQCGQFCSQLPGRLTACVDAAESCDAFTACFDAPPAPGQCDALCDLADACGFVSAAECAGFCADIPPPVRDCAAAADACPDLAACFEGPPPDPRQLCQADCQRTAQCIFRECAAGSLPDGWVGRCVDACVVDPPTADAVQAHQAALCSDVVAERRAQDAALDAACDADAAAACETLCADTIGPCTDAPLADCLADCATFDAANLRCVQLAPTCDDVLACYGDPEGQDRCARFCGRLQGCLEEACPPRIIPPELSVNCTAGCLDQPPTDEQVANVEAATCAEVRQIVYRNNRELAPICEGDPDFRPSPDECAAFCDNGLQACIGLGGRDFCLAACASLTRDEYACALAAQGDCDAIGVCLAGE
ncbi:MAG: hypothetical protein H6706_09780 [Myxococcales bacterium]|nr:hypothetical protein [Myxococcales bacterium]